MFYSDIYKNGIREVKVHDTLFSLKCYLNRVYHENIVYFSTTFGMLPLNEITVDIAYNLMKYNTLKEVSISD